MAEALAFVCARVCALCMFVVHVVYLNLMTKLCH